jgi:hypothetical protein
LRIFSSNAWALVRGHTVDRFNTDPQKVSDQGILPDGTFSTSKPNKGSP